MTSEGHAPARSRRALETRALWAAEDAAREIPQLALEDALQLVHLYAERGSPKFCGGDALAPTLSSPLNDLDRKQALAGSRKL